MSVTGLGWAEMAEWMRLHLQTWTLGSTMQTARGPLSYVSVSMAGGWKVVWERRRNPGGSVAEALRGNGGPQLGALPPVPTDM